MNKRTHYEVSEELFSLGLSRCTAHDLTFSNRCLNCMKDYDDRGTEKPAIEDDRKDGGK